jgi:hypothetical protein
MTKEREGMRNEGRSRLRPFDNESERLGGSEGLNCSSGYISLR